MGWITRLEAVGRQEMQRELDLGAGRKKHEHHKSFSIWEAFWMQMLVGIRTVLYSMVYIYVDKY